MGEGGACCSRSHGKGRGRGEWMEPRSRSRPRLCTSAARRMKEGAAPRTRRAPAEPSANVPTHDGGEWSPPWSRSRVDGACYRRVDEPRAAIMLNGKRIAVGPPAYNAEAPLARTPDSIDP